jgi:hypothetical protein
MKLKRKKERAIKARYSEPDYNEQSPEEKLAGALRSQERGTDSLLHLLEAMRSPTEFERRADMFNSSSSFTPEGLVFQKESGEIMYQPPSDTEGEYLGSGRRIHKQDIGDITGGRAETTSKGQSEVAKMLQDPAVLRFFMDIYSESGKQKKGKTASISSKGSGCKPDKDGKIPESCKGKLSWTN